MNTRGPLVYIIDDDDAVRQSLSWLVSSADYATRVFPSADIFLQQCRQMERGCIITDIRMPGLSGLDLQTELTARGIDLPVIVITGHGDVQTAVRAMKAGAYDFIEKPFKDHVLLDLVNRAVAHNLSVGEELQERADLRERHDSLTTREQQVMALIVDGEANKVIAYKLDISDKTVEAHRAKVMRKMSARSLAELVRMALKLKQN